MRFYIPTRLIAGRGCLRREGQALACLGRRAFVVTSPSAGRVSGALEDLYAVLDGADIAHQEFSEVEQNPSIESCHRAGELARAFGADFVVGVGGGSPLDAAKACAAFATRPERPVMELFDNLPIPSLPIAAIPTTAGTGSEVNGFSVLTIDGGRRKKTFKVDYNFPTVAFLDAAYTKKLPVRLAVATALDALCHCAESYLTPDENAASDALALAAARDIWDLLPALAAGTADFDVRQRMLEASAMGGMAIAHTGTGMPHPMGYSLSLFHGLPHGAACALFLPAHLEAVHTARPAQVAALLSAMKTAIPEIFDRLAGLHGFTEALTEEQIERYMALTAGAPSFSNGFVTVEDDRRRAMYRALPTLPRWSA